MSVDDQHALCPEPTGDLGHHRRELRIVHAEELSLRPGRVRERAEDVEHGADADLATRGTGVTHARVKCLREQEAHAALVDTAGHVDRAQGDIDAERLEHVSATRGARDGAVAVFRDRHARATRPRTPSSSRC